VSAKYSKRDREDAALFCSARACAHGFMHSPYDVARASMPISKTAESLAWRARANNNGLPGVAVIWAEAEALLRTGWTP
jgi:hypothetical protein